MKLPLRPPCRANCFASFGPVYSLIGPIWTDFIKKSENYIKNEVKIGIEQIPSTVTILKMS